MLYSQQYQKAALEFELALNMSRKKRMLAFEIETGFNLIDALICLMNLEKAKDELNKLQAAIMKQSSMCSKGLDFAYQARIYWKQNKPEDAANYFKQGLEIIENAKCRTDQSARTYLAFAEFMIEKGQPREAKAALQKGREIFSELHNELGLKSIEDLLTSINH